MKQWALLLVLLVLAACGSAPKKPGTPVDRQAHAPLPARCKGAAYAPATEDVRKRGNYTAGGLYAPGVRDSAPRGSIDIDCIPEPQVTDEPRSPQGNQSPYTVLGKRYHVLNSAEGYAARGVASYYGNKFHGRRTSNQEVYDMYAFTAAHKSLPLPSFAEVTNLETGQSVIVRINDRGPFHDGRLIDLSYAAAVKIGIHPRGTGHVEVRALTPSNTSTYASRDRRRATATATEASNAPDIATDTSPTGMDLLVSRLAVDHPLSETAGLPTATSSRRQSRAARRSAARPNARIEATSPPPSSVNATTGAAGAAHHRYYVESMTGETPSADRFDAWMASQGLSIATGRPRPVASSTIAATTTSSATVPASSASRRTQRLIQVASFSNLDNAHRALAQLNSAGIENAILTDVITHGKTLWRVRVPSEETQIEELVGRLMSLGFGQPQIVRE